MLFEVQKVIAKVSVNFNSNCEPSLVQTSQTLTFKLSLKLCLTGLHLDEVAWWHFGREGQGSILAQCEILGLYCGVRTCTLT